ncbi:MAG: peptidase C15 [Cyanobacteria bacterium P01_G01_bin.67]
MKSKILLTSFQTWLDHQKSNSSDDLLEILQQQNNDFVSLYFLRQLPVDVQLATQQVISQIQTLEPDGIICCGMAEKRKKLSIESQATCNNQCLYTLVNISELIQQLSITELSQDAGKFVCEGLYYQVLKYTQSLAPKIPCIFIHVPILNKSNQDLIHTDFNSIIEYMKQIFKSQVNN